jgi:hypothetical protein
VNWDTLQAVIKAAVVAGATFVQPGFKPGLVVYSGEPQPYGDPVVKLDILGSPEDAAVRTVRGVAEGGLGTKSYSSLIAPRVQIKVETVAHTTGTKAIQFAESLRQALKSEAVQAVLNPGGQDRVALLGQITPIRPMRVTVDDHELSVFAFEVQFRTEFHADDPVSGGVIEHVTITGKNFPAEGGDSAITVDKA